MNKLRAAFRDHRKHAKARGIEFLLTYEEWLKIWEDSGKLAQRGVGPDKFCMSRRGDKGPYEVGNVQIKTFGANTREAWLGRKRKFRAKSPEHCENIRKALRGKPKTLRHTYNMTKARWGLADTQ
jgi:hypothetical protein